MVHKLRSKTATSGMNPKYADRIFDWINAEVRGCGEMKEEKLDMTHKRIHSPSNE